MWVEYPDDKSTFTMEDQYLLGMFYLSSFGPVADTTEEVGNLSPTLSRKPLNGNVAEFLRNKASCNNNPSTTKQWEAINWTVTLQEIYMGSKCFAIDHNVFFSRTGRDLLVKPVTTQGQATLDVYLPGKDEV